MFYNRGLEKLENAGDSEKQLNVSMFNRSLLANGPSNLSNALGKRQSGQYGRLRLR